MKSHLLLAPLLAASAAAFAGPYDQPYSIIEDDSIRSADPKVIHVLVNRVDDRNALDIRHAVVPPGRHDVTVDVPPRRGFPATQHTFELVTEPCMRYSISAQLDNVLLQRWKPIVRDQERIGECEAKFALGR